MTRAHTSALIVLAIGLVLAAALPAVASGGGSAGTLQINDTLETTPWQNVSCPAGTSGANPQCYAITGQGVVPGLGKTSESYFFWMEDHTTDSTPAHFTATITVSDKGTISVSGATPQPICSCGEAALDYTVIGGTGDYAGASGSGTTTLAGLSKFARWVGTVTVPGYTFDTTPPVINGAKAKTVKAPKGTKRVRVKYTVTSSDPDEGSVPVTCKPRSGSRFKIGRTTVTCIAIDANGNAATTHFRVTVKRAN